MNNKHYASTFAETMLRLRAGRFDSLHFTHKEKLCEKIILKRLSEILEKEKFIHLLILSDLP